MTMAKYEIKTEDKHLMSETIPDLLFDVFEIAISSGWRFQCKRPEIGEYVIGTESIFPVSEKNHSYWDNGGYTLVLIPPKKETLKEWKTRVEHTIKDLHNKHERDDLLKEFYEMPEVE